MSHDYVFTLQRVRKNYGQKVVLDDISLSFFRGARIGVIGHNGSGKTTLLRVLAGVEDEFDGTRWAPDNLSIGYLSQEPELTPGTVRDNLEEAVSEVTGLLRRYEELNEELGKEEVYSDADRMQAVLDEQMHVESEIQHKGAWEIEHTLDQASHALGLPPPDADVGTCSGGERRRVALCKILLQHPDVLLLDEPTNHLDADAVYWLERHLDAYDGTVISITHDRYFLDNVAQWMLEMHEGKAYPYEGNYSAYLVRRQERDRSEDARSKARQKRLDNELAWIQRNPKGRMAKNKARIRDYEALYQQHVDSQKAAEGVSLMIPTTQKLGTKVLILDGICKSFGDRSVLKDISFEVPAGAIVGVIGPNGTGKTTLLKIISGQIAADAGTVDIGPTVDLCYVDQDRGDLDPDKTVWQEITDGADELTLGRQKVNSRAYVSKFNFRGADQQALVGQLSGGQRNRVQLAKMLRRGGNLLLVDEPTNDLDVDTIRVLEEALEGFAGSAIVVSHDRFFLDKVATHILAFEEEGRGRFWEGNYQTYSERRREELEASGQSTERRGKYRRLS
ncbi:MAG: energy-dependent translational throttle protein EttA [Planctomycetota bacterium]|nr:energy-dependent translational throttle protein EttA [Planctomycetota bacterium]